MIRSLVITPNPEFSMNGAGQAVPGDLSVLRRNLTQEKLELCLAEGCSMWMDIVNPETEEIHWLEGLLELSATVVADLLREDRRPTLLVYPHYLFLSLFQPYAQGNGIVGKEIHCIVGEHFCVTVHQADASAVEEAYNRVVQNPDAWQRGVAYFLYLTAQHVIDTYYPLLDRISNQLNDLEEKLLSDGADKQAQKSVYHIKQQLIVVRQMIAPQREVLSNLMGEQRVSSNNDIRDLFRHLYERLLGIYDVIDSQRDLTSNVLEIIASQHSRKMGEALTRLTIFSMVFLPLTFFIGFFQLPFATIREPVELPISGQAILVILIALMITSVIGLVSLFRYRGWI
jgi:magnesium transporter